MSTLPTPTTTTATTIAAQLYCAAVLAGGPNMPAKDRRQWAAFAFDFAVDFMAEAARRNTVTGAVLPNYTGLPSGDATCDEAITVESHL